MADPAVEAARRAWENGPDEVAKLHYTQGEDGVWSPVAMEAAAREVLKPIRELHKPEVVRSPDDEQWTECTSCYGAHWPCETAKSIYTSEELS